MTRVPRRYARQHQIDQTREASGFDCVRFLHSCLRESDRITEFISIRWKNEE